MMHRHQGNSTTVNADGRRGPRDTPSGLRRVVPKVRARGLRATVTLVALVLALTALAMLVSGVGPARADSILYTQGSPSGDTPGVFSNGPASGAFAAVPPETQEVANHFTLATPGTPTTLQWFGQPSSHPVGTPEVFLLRLYSDNAGLPGSLLYEQSATILGLQAFSAENLL
jgi:hypothetical protein